ncbi:MAG: phage holin family protein [Nostocoides sp.]
MAIDTKGSQRTVGQLVADATHDVQGLIRSEIALAKAEISSGAKVMGVGAGMLAGAGFLALLGLIFLFITIAVTLDIWLPAWLAWLIVTAFLFIVAAIAGLLAVKALKKARPAPEKAIAEAKLTIAAIKASS